jgi:hypothetical protein
MSVLSGIKIPYWLPHDEAEWHFTPSHTTSKTDTAFQGSASPGAAQSAGAGVGHNPIDEDFIRHDCRNPFFCLDSIVLLQISWVEINASWLVYMHPGPPKSKRQRSKTT